MNSTANLFESQNTLRVNESSLDIGNQVPQVKIKKKQEIKQWDNPIEFLMTCIGYAVGIGGVIRFPYLCFANGGCAFVIAFLIMLFFFGVPLFFLELTISQYSKCGADKVWKCIPLLRGLGVCSVVINVFFCIYFNVLICYSVIYLIQSFFPVIPWSHCDNWWNNEKCISPDEMANFTSFGMNASMISAARGVTLESSAKQYFTNFILEQSEGIEFPDGQNLKVVAALFFCWIMAFLALLKGISSLGKVSYFTAIFPYVMITILIIRGCTLPGAIKGLEFYIMKVDMVKLFTLQTWIDACSQALFCLGIAQGSLLTLGKHNSFNYNHQKATFFIAVLDGFTGVYAGFAIFSVLGFMAESTGQEVKDLAVGGLGLSFMVYPEALSLMPFPWVWCIFFFMMMITIGFGSLLSMTECALDTISCVFKVSKKYNALLRFCTCMFFFACGLTMTTRGGYYLVNLVDNYTCTIPIILLATLEAVGLGWFYGVHRIQANIKTMLNIELNLYWKMCFKVITPTIAIVMLAITLLTNGEVKLDKYVYPRWAHIVGFTIVCICLCPLFIFAIRSLHFAGVFDIIKDLMKPGDNWKPAFDDNDTDDSSASNSNQSLNRQKNDKPTKKSNKNHEYTSVKLQRITESKAQIILHNSDDEDED